MEPLRWSYRPDVNRPIIVAAFEGWNDAGDAASAAVRWFSDRWSAMPFADIDPEDFFDFTATRPEVRIEDGDRVIDWPTNEFLTGTLPGTDRDVILLQGVEPQLKWRTFCDVILSVAEMFDAAMVITLGALLAEVPHTRPVGIAGSAYDPDVVERLALAPSRYEGPTGIVGVLHGRCRAVGIESASLWATVPTYVPSAPAPKATLALVEKAAELLGVGVITTDLEIAAASYERQINQLMEDDDDTREYVARLEQRHDDALHDEHVDLIDEVERFLRDNGA